MKYQIAIIGGGPAGYTAAEVAEKPASVLCCLKRGVWGAVPE